MKKLLPIVIALICVAGSAFATPLIAEWNFNSLVSGTNPLTVAPSAQLFTDTSSQFWLSGVNPASSGAYSTQSSSSDGKSSDPTASSSSTYSAYNTTAWDAAGDKTAWRHSTVGYQNIKAEFDYRSSTTLATDFRWVYSINGGSTWTTSSTITTTNDSKWHDNIASLVLPSVCNNAANFAVGVMWNSGGASTGTFRFDMLQIYGDAIPVTPEPGSLLALFTGCVGLVSFVRRVRK